MVTESWFSRVGSHFGNSWISSWKRTNEHDKAVIGVLAFEVGSLMSKVVHLWQCLSEKEVVRLRDEVIASEGVTRLVSNDENYLLGLAFAEMMDNLLFVARSVARLGKRCSVAVLQGFEPVFEDLVRNGADLSGWEFTWKKMERKVKKMEKFISASADLYQEMEVLSEFEHGLRRMRVNEDPNRGNILDFQHKVVLQRQEVKALKEISLWNRSYDYVVRLLARSLVTIFGRVRHVFGINQTPIVRKIDDTRILNSLPRSQSVSALTHSLVCPSENNGARAMFCSGPLDRSISKPGPISSTVGTVGGQHANGNRLHHNRLPPLPGKYIIAKTKRSATPGRPFKSCISGGNDSPVLQSSLPLGTGPHISVGNKLNGVNGTKETYPESIVYGNVFTDLPFFNSKFRYLSAPAWTLGATGLALHYANVVILIEKLVASPHLISPDARDDLYNMLPTSVRATLRARLKTYAKNLASSVYDTILAAEWSEALVRILEWLAPLAHSMVRWQTERSFEQQHTFAKTNVLLLQTLYFANQAKAEAAITELLVGLNYIWRFERELNAKALLECASNGGYDDYLDSKIDEVVIKLYLGHGMRQLQGKGSCIIRAYDIFPGESFTQC